jgi:hypothetical protein
MSNDSSLSPRTHEYEAAWRSGGAHDLARELVLVARTEGGDLQLQEAIAEIVIASQEPPSKDDIAYITRE